MALWWMVYEDNSGICAVVEEAPSLVMARLKANIAHHVDAHFVEAHELPPDFAKAKPPIGKLLNVIEAHELLRHVERVA